MQKTNLQVMNMIGSSLAAVIPQLTAGNKRASIVFRPKQQPVHEGFVPLPAAQAEASLLSLDDNEPPKRLRQSARKL